MSESFDAAAEIERLEEQVVELSRGLSIYRQLYEAASVRPTCAICHEPAACIGWSLDGGVAPMCDECCGHGQEDSECHPVPPARAEIERLKTALDDARHAVELAESEVAGRDQEIERLEQRVAELQAVNWYWDDRCLDFAYDSLDEPTSGDALGDIIELRPLHELPTIYVLITEDGPVVYPSREAAEAGKDE